MLKDRAKQKAKSRAKQKVRSSAKNKIHEAGRDESAPKVLKAAAVGGTAYYAGKKIQEKHDGEKVETYAQPAVTTSEAPIEVTGTDMVEQLQQLAQLHDTGALTDEEFASAKQKLLA